MHLLDQKPTVTPYPKHKATKNQVPYPKSGQTKIKKPLQGPQVKKHPKASKTADPNCLNFKLAPPPPK